MRRARPGVAPLRPRKFGEPRFDRGEPAHEAARLQELAAPPAAFRQITVEGFLIDLLPGTHVLVRRRVLSRYSSRFPLILSLSLGITRMVVGQAAGRGVPAFRAFMTNCSQSP